MCCRVLRAWVRGDAISIVLGVGLLLLFLKFFLWPLARFDAPIGYDAGMYRYLFLRYSEAFPPFTFPELPPWAREHPPGLFLFSSILLRFGVPVDWLLGWMWSFFSILLIVCSSVVVWRKWGRAAGIVTLFLFVLAPAYYDGFAAMYWKTFAALLWTMLSFSFLERRQWFFGSVFAFLTLITHQQTGLLFILATASWLFLFACSSWFLAGFSRRHVLLFLVGSAAFFGLVVLFYGQLFDDIIKRLLPLLFQGSRAPPGSFPPPDFYLRHSWPLLLFGFLGVFHDLRRERWTLWQLTLLWSFLFIALRLIFYRRFFLQFEFFLIPFAAWSIGLFWRRSSSLLLRGSIIVLLLVQSTLSLPMILQRTPAVSADVFAAVQSLPVFVPDRALVLTLEPTTTPLLRGWLPKHRVGGPGLFDSSWSEMQWEKFLLGTSEERKELLVTLSGTVFLFVSPEFSSLYGRDAERFLADPCFVKENSTFLYRVKEGCLVFPPPRGEG